MAKLSWKACWLMLGAEGKVDDNGDYFSKLGLKVEDSSQMGWHKSNFPPGTKMCSLALDGKSHTLLRLRGANSLGGVLCFIMKETLVIRGHDLCLSAAKQ